MTVDDLKTHYGAKSDAALARAMSRPRSTIHYWKKGGIPVSTQAYFQAITKGKLKADLTATT